MAMTQITAIDGTALSPLTFGAMQFGSGADEAAAHGLFDAARAAGVTHFDTAYAYTDGQSERWLGAMAAPERESLIIATKHGYTGGAGRENILRAFDVSRLRLGLDVVDILYLHRFDPDTPLAETFETLAALQERGQVRYLGVSNYAAWQVVKAQGVAESLGTRIDIIQPMYNLVKRQAEVELFPMAIDLGLAIAPYSPLGAGLLTGKYIRGEAGRLSRDSRYAARYGEAWMHDTAQAFAELAQELGQPPAALAVAWAMAHPARPVPIISARSAEQLASSLAAQEIEMTPELYDRIRALSRQPAPATDRLEEA